jgi:very-short-patch-repair endonuclease
MFQKGHKINLGRKQTKEHKKKIGLANSISLKGRIIPKETRERMSKNNACFWLGKKRDKKTNEKISKAQKGKHHSVKTEFKKGHIPRIEIIKKVALKLKGKKRPSFSKEWKRNISKSQRGRKYSEETKRKMRESALNYIKKVSGIVCPRIGRNEKELLDELENKLGYRIIRQYRIGGYFLDGYIPEINLAIEVDEKYHENNKEKDIKREEYIKQKLGCKFLRIKDYKLAL